MRTRDGASATGEVPPATAEQLVAQLQRQAAAVRVVRYPDVAIDLDGPNLPVRSLGNSTLIAAQPRSLFLKGGKTGLGGLIEVGSDDREFWLVLDPPARDKVFVVCAHDDFPRAAHKLPVPFDPQWAMLALGMVAPDPAAGPYTVETSQKDRTYTLTRPASAPDGRRVEHHTVFAADTQTGTKPQVRQHIVTEPGGKRVITRAAVASVHRLPGGEEVPTDLALDWPEQQFKMRLRLGAPTVNEPMTPEKAQGLFGRPQVRGARPLNLADADVLPTGRGVERGAAPDAPRRGFFGRR